MLASLFLLSCSQAGRVPLGGLVGEVPLPADSAQVPTGDSAEPPEPVRWQQVSSGYFHTCGLLSTGSIVCWGVDNYGVLDAPVGQYLAVASGAEYTCALGTDGLVTCWGCEMPAYAADLCTRAPTIPLVSLDAGAWHACGEDRAGDLHCWGYELDVPEDWSYVPGPLADYSLAEYGTCLLDPISFVPVCQGGIGVPEDGSGMHVPEPPPGVQFVQVATGQNHVCGLKAGGQAMCWGESIGPDVPVVPAPEDEVFSVIDGCAFDTCGLRVGDGFPVCWGGMMNNPLAGVYATPPAIPLETLSVGEYHACGVGLGGQEVVCWGGNRGGEGDPPTLEEAIALTSGTTE